MATADVARLRFILSADSGGLKAGCKEGVGSLKDMSSQVGSAMNKMDTGGMDWKGLKKSARSLKFVGREMGGMFKGAIGDAMGVATMGAHMGAIGAGAAGVAILDSMIEKQGQARDEERKKASQSLRESSAVTYAGAKSSGLDAGTFTTLGAIAGDDKKFLDDLAVGMKRLQDAGPGAAEQLKQFGADVEKFKISLGIGGESGKAMEKDRLALSGEKRLQDAGGGKKVTEGMLGFTTTESQEAETKQTAVMRDYFTEKYKKEGLGEDEAKKKAADKTSGFRSYSTGSLTDKYKDTMAEYGADMNEQEKKLREKADLQGKGDKERLGLRTNKEKLNDRLSEIEKIKGAGGYGTTDEENQQMAGRATSEALNDYKKTQGGPAGMAGAATAGSAEAYSVIAGAQMGAASDKNSTAETNAILQAQFPELIQAVKGLNPNWRKADTAT